MGSAIARACPAAAGHSRRIAVTIVLSLVATVLTATLAGCGGVSAADAQSSIHAGIDKDMNTLRTLTTAEAKEMFPSEFTDELSRAGIDVAAVYGPLFSSMTYTIDDVAVDAGAGTADVQVTVENIDVPAALAHYASALTDYLTSQKTSGGSSDQDAIVRMAELLSASLNDDSLDRVSTTVSVPYALQGSAWVAQDTSALRRAVLGGLDPATIATRLQQ